jgi:hypothetical protein
MNGLVISEPWIGLILSGTKTWEMRTAPTRYRGRVGLIRKGSGMVVGAADLVDSLRPIDAAGLAATRDRHGIPHSLDAEAIKARWVHPWVLHNVYRLKQLIPAGQKAGQVIWVTLSPATVHAIENQCKPLAIQEDVL